MFDSRQLLDALIAGLEEVLPAASELRTVLHTQPQVGGAEGPTRDTLLEAMPWARASSVAETGMVVRLGPVDGPAVALRAELDALPIIEQTGVHWASENQNMHACGHDVHMAALWALLQAASSLDDLPVGMVGLFQPREEVQPSGASDVLRSGILDEHGVRALVAAHVQPRVPVGTVSTGVGGVNAAADEFTVVVQGYGGHGAYPHVTVDPVPVLAAITLGLHELVGRTIDPTHPTLITVGRLQAGTTANVIPESGSLHGILRTTNEGDRAALQASIRRLAEHTAAARGAHAEVTITVGDPVLDNDADLVAAVDPLLEHAELTVAATPFRSCGADDFSHYVHQGPILMMFVGTGDGRTQGQAVGLHHPHFLPDEEALRAVALSLAAAYVGAAETLTRG